MKKLFPIFYFLFFFTSLLAQGSELFDYGYKDFDWGISTNTVDTLIADDFHIDSFSPKSFLLTQTDKETDVDYIKKESNVEYKYMFIFFNDSLYQITLRVETSEDDNYPLLREIEQSYSKDIVNSYGKPKDEKNIDEIYRVMHSSTWFSNKVDIQKYYNEKNRESFGGYVIDEIVFELKITDKNKNKEIEGRIEKYQTEKRNKEIEDAKIKAKSIREKF